VNKTKTFDVVAIGGATRDVFLRISEGKIICTPENPIAQKLVAFEYGAKIVPKETYFSFGGGGTNAAISCARLGLKTRAVICIGEEGTGDLVLENLEKSKVDTGFVVRDPKLHTALSIMLSVPSGERIVFRSVGADENLKLDKLRNVKTKWFYVTSLRRKSAKLLSDIAKVAGKGEVKLALNPGEEQIRKGYKGLKEILEATFVLIVNRDEAMELVLSKTKKACRMKISELISEIKNWGPRVVVITDGKKGAYASDDHTVYFAPILKNKVVDTTGAGDAFGSSFIAGLENYKDAKKSLALASVNSASVVSYLGAQKGLLKLKEAEKLIKKIKVRESKIK